MNGIGKNGREKSRSAIGALEGSRDKAGAGGGSLPGRPGGDRKSCRDKLPEPEDGSLIKYCVKQLIVESLLKRS